MYAGNEVFFDGVEVNRGYAGLAAFAGTNAVWKMQALYHVGGLQYGSLTEDALTGMAVHMAGFTSAYNRKEMAVGLSPQSVNDAMQQRMRWSQGAVEMALKVLERIFTGQALVDNILVLTELTHVISASKRISPPTPLKRFMVCVIYFD